ncbi:plasma-membrane proton-efflux P-type ATPase [Acidocella aquatica]|uniref:Plasma-membrane proton-efflux P-type ATPase n=1 Tax=Acidocella aquatica TaxID=1922313 RepID=A0ABQ6AD81_9PROT|nr:HAD-IC family P-type ATPase [Acidocella aquatica]GLR68000.1 plasma-membrane proton-efflux P-type ATPase [Acidocella aquatica]
MDAQTGPELSSAEAALRLQQFGPNAVAETSEHWPRALAAKLWTPLSWMLEATILLELFLGHGPQALIILVLLLFNAVLGLSQEARAKGAVAALRQKLAVMASVRRDGAWLRINAAGLVPGDLVKLALGAVVPADIKITAGTALIDQSMLTGESLPVERKAGDTAYAGAMVRQGEATGLVTATGARTYFGKTASLVQDARSVSGEQRAVLAVVRDLALINGAIVLAMLVYAHEIGRSFDESVPLLLTALLASIPVALPSTFTLAAALSARSLVRGSVLPTRLAAINEAATMSLLCTDKTGTLTKNALSIQSIACFGGADEGAVLAAAAAASSEGGDPVDQVIIDAARARGVAVPLAAAFAPFDPARKYAQASLPNGDLLRKGAPGALLPAGLTPEQEAARQRLAQAGCRILAVARITGNTVQLLGLLGLADPPRDDAAGLIASLRALGVRVVMVTGDAPETAAVIARAVGITGQVCDSATLETLKAPDDFAVFAGVFPEQKFRLVKLFQRDGHVVGMCGDGTNDAPALRQAQMGIAVASATDVAKAAAGLVLTSPGLAGILGAIHEGRAAFQRIRTYTLTMVVRKIAFAAYLALGLVITGHAVLTPLLMVLLLIVNDFLTMAITTDRALPSAHPRHWRIGRIIAEGCLYGLATLGYVTLMLLAGHAIWHLPLLQIRTLSFLTLMLAVQANVYVVREERWFWSSAPSPLLAASSLVMAASSLMAAGFGVLMAPLGSNILAAIAASVILFLFLLDLLKRLAGLLAHRPAAEVAFPPPPGA